MVSIDGLLALLAAFLKQTCYFYYFIYCSVFFWKIHSSSSSSVWVLITVLPYFDDDTLMFLDSVKHDENVKYYYGLSCLITLHLIWILALGEATKIAQTLSSFPQECLRQDRLSAYNSCFNASSLAEALKFEWDSAVHVVRKESVQGCIAHLFDRCRQIG